VFADHVPTQPPYDQSLALDSSTGDLTVGIYSSDGFEDSPPEKYTIWFTISDSEIDTSTAFCISTSFGHGQNLTWQYHVFSLEDLQYYFEVPNGTFRTKIRADNDTDNSFSTLTAEMTISIPDQLPFVNLGNWTEPSSTCNDTSTTTTTSSTTSSSTTSSSTTSSTTTLPPKPEPPPPPPPTTTTTLPPVIVEIGGEEVEYTQVEVEDGTLDRDKERAKNEDLYGCSLTDAQLERGDDCNGSVIVIDDEKTEFVEDGDEFETYEDSLKGEDLELENDPDLSDQEILDQEKEEEILKELEDSPLAEIIGDDDDAVQDFVDTLKKIEEETDFDSLSVEDEVIIIEIPEDFEIEIVEPEVEETKPIIEDFESDEVLESEDPVKISDEIIETVEDDVIEIVEVIVEVIEIVEDEIPELPTEVTENLEAEKVEEAVEVFVESLEPETKVEIIEDVVEVGVEELTEEQVTVVAEVVESAIDDVEELTDEQVETVAEVLGLEESDDVAVIAEAVKSDEAVAEAVDVFVERAVENAEVEDYNLSDVVVEVQVEEFLENPAVIFQVDFEEIDLTSLGDDLTNQQKEKAQEVVVPVIIASQIISASVVPFRRIN